MARVRTIEGALCVGALLLVGHAARAAETESPHFRLAYDAPSGCPDRGAFLDAIRARTPRPRLAATDDQEPAITLHVAIDSGDESTSGRLELREPDGTEETRSVTGRTCGEVMKALALVAAVMLDPEARMGPEPPVPSPPSPPPPTSSAAPPPKPRPPQPSSPRPRRRSAWRPAAGAEIGMLGGVGPGVAPMAGAFFDVERASRALTSTARLSLDVATTSSNLRGGSQTYEWLGATLRICPAYVSLPVRLRVAPCAALQTAGHRGTPRNVRNATTNVDLWLAPALAGALEWEASPALSVELQGGVLFPLRRTRFFLAPDSTIFEIPAAAGTVSLGVRIRFL